VAAGPLGAGLVHERRSALMNGFKISDSNGEPQARLPQGSMKRSTHPGDERRRSIVLEGGALTRSFTNCEGPT